MRHVFFYLNIDGKEYTSNHLEIKPGPDGESPMLIMDNALLYVDNIHAATIHIAETHEVKKFKPGNIGYRNNE